MYYIMLNLIKTTICISMVIILIKLSKDKFLNNYTHRFNYLICILITVRMLFIFSLEVYIPKEILNKVSNSSMLNASNLSLDNYTYNFMKILFCIWLSGVIFVLSKEIYKQITFNKKIKNISFRVKDKEIVKSYEEQKELLNIKSNLKIFKMNGLASPALVGTFNSKIIIPDKEYDIAQLNWIFRHELVHYKRKDNLLKFLLMIGCSIHWFNPLIKIFKEYFEERCELSCDENVVNRFSKDEAKEYALVLVNTLRYRNSLKVTMLSSELNTKGIDIIKSRIESMLSTKKKKKGLLAGIFMFIFIFISLFSVNNKNTVATSYAQNSNSINLYSDKTYNELTEEQKKEGMKLLKSGEYTEVKMGSDAIFSSNNMKK